MGLFDEVFASPDSQAMFALGSGLLGVRRGDEGKALMGAMGSYNQASQAQRQARHQDLLEQQARMQMQQQQQQLADQEAQRKFFGDPARLMNPAQPGVQGNEMDPGMPALPAAPKDPRQIAQALMQSGNPALVQQGYALLTKQEAPMKVGKDDRLLAPDGKGGFRTLVDALPDEAKTTELTKLITERNKLPPGHPIRAQYDAMIVKLTTHAPGTNVTVGLQAPYAGLDAQGNPIVLQPANRPGAPPQLLTDPRTGQPIQPPRPAIENKPMTDVQANANLYSSRMEKADKIINAQEGNYNRLGLAGRQRAGDGFVGAAANSQLSGGAQQADQAQRDFVNATLRRESGAAISASEFVSARQQYFPQPGDLPAVVKQKADNRKTAIEGIRAAAGLRAPINQVGNQNVDPLNLRNQ